MSIELRDLEADEADALQELLESDPGYAERVTGHPPGAADAQSLLLTRPPDLAEDDKRVLGAWDVEVLVGVVDLLRGWPDEQTVHVGLLLVRGDRQRQGLGTLVHGLAVELAHRWAPGATRLRAAIVAANAQAEPFWAGRGYRPTGETKPYRYDRLESTVAIWERPLP